MRDLMRAQFERQVQWRAVNGDQWARQNAKRPDLAQLVFADTLGRPCRRQDDGKRWHELLDAAGYPDFDVSAHKTRHIAVTALALENVPLAVVGQIAGHASEEITRVYTHARSEDALKYLEAIDEKYDAEEQAQENARLVEQMTMTPEEIEERRESRRADYRADLAACEVRNPHGVELDLFDPHSDPKPRDPDEPALMTVASGSAASHSPFTDDLADF